MSETIDSVAAALATRTVIVPIAGPMPAPPAPLPLSVGLDIHARPWVYAYTSQATFDEVFHGNSYSAKTLFPVLFRIVDADPNLAGIVLNSGSAGSYLIMRVLFDHVRRAMPIERKVQDAL